MKMNKLMNRFFGLAAIGLLGLALLSTFANRINAKTDLKKMLAGEKSKRWHLNMLKTVGEEKKEEDFDRDKEFALESDLAQLVPGTIVFNADGTCENTYFSGYKDGQKTEEDYIAPCKWSVDGNTVEIIENVNGDNKIEKSRDETLWLKEVGITDQSFSSRFSLQDDYTGGVEELGYELEGGKESN